MTLTKNYVSNPKNLEVYKKAKEFTKEIYSEVESFPNIEKYNMCDQLRRCSSSVVANLVEGHRNYYYGKERDRLNSALGSIAECQAFLDLACMLNYVSQKKYEEMNDAAEEIFRMLLGMIKRVDKMIIKNS